LAKNDRVLKALLRTNSQALPCSALVPERVITLSAAQALRSFPVRQCAIFLGIESLDEGFEWATFIRNGCCYPS
jgi:hypothetical protein